VTLESGKRLGPYEIVSPIGAGGMGEVYKAHDTRLDRTVAIKVLPEELSDNAELRERFEREARAISSLNHPHICTLYDVGCEDGIDFLVMEYLEGETLAERLRRGALRLDEALRYAIQIADALDNAHRHGVVHRDLKPGNIMLTEVGAILLDFGLARLRQLVRRSLDEGGGFGEAGPSLSSISTKVKPLTEKGAILGTFQYMAPEQLEGLEADARSDVFAFGAVVYKMLSGKRAFEGESQASLIAAILEREPTPLSSLQPMTPPALERTIRKALSKEPHRRWQDVGDFGSELQWISEGGGLAVLREPSRSRQALPFAIGAIVGVLVSGLAVWSMMRPGPPLVTHSTLLLPSMPERGSSPLALSPDGTRVVYATAGEGIYLRVLNDLEAHPISGTEGGHTPFFSPDGQWIGFFTNEALKKVAIGGGAPLTLCTVSGHDSRGATWGPDGTIVFGTQGPLFEISAGGGTPREITAIDVERRESSHRWPQFLPKGNGLVFTIRTRDGWDIAALSRDTGEVHRLDKLGQGIALRFERPPRLRTVWWATGGTIRPESAHARRRSHLDGRERADDRHRST
jgi:serine/threonine protein kinase